MAYRTLMLAATLLLTAALATAAPKDPSETDFPKLLSHLPQDPVMAFASFDLRPVETWDAMLEIAGELLPAEDVENMREELMKFDETLGVSVRDDFLAQIGPEVAFVLDLPVLDDTMMQVMMGEGSSSQALGGVGFVVRVKDASTFETTLGKLFALAEAKPSKQSGITRMRFDLGDETQTAASGSSVPIDHVDVFFGSSKGLFAMGFNSDFVTSSLTGAGPAGIASGGDFQRVFAKLDHQPEMLTYVNVPKIVSRVMGSEMASGFLQASEEAKPFVEFLNSPDVTGMGIGSTSVTVDGGVRTTTYGPKALSPGLFQVGVISSILIPNFATALDKAKQKRTRGEIEAAAIAVELLLAEHPELSTATDGWVPLDSLGTDATWSTTDGWGNPIWYRSDGESFELMSYGKDGAMDEVHDPEADEFTLLEDDGFSADVRYTDGAFTG